MKHFFWGIILLLLSCKGSDVKNGSGNISVDIPDGAVDFTIAFGSCNKTEVPNLLWDDIKNEKPDVWIWGGDNVYADTDNEEKLKAYYDKQLKDKAYRSLKEETQILGTWDDHDYGMNDGGIHFHFKETSQKLFLDFLGVPEKDIRREQKGIYHTVDFKLKSGSIRIIILDTRYFRSDLTDDLQSKKRYKPNAYGDGTVLGEAQWKWFADQLESSEADFNIVVSSIQLLSAKHGYETWGNFPHEVDKFLSVVKESNAKGVIVLSGDRHISDFSKIEIKGMSYPLIDFTSSGLTHAATNNKGEENPYRVGKMINQISYGVLKFDMKRKKVIMEMKGNGGELQQYLMQTY